MSAQRQRPIDFATEGLLLAHRVGRNCGSGLNPNPAADIFEIRDRTARARQACIKSFLRRLGGRGSTIDSRRRVLKQRCPLGSGIMRRDSFKRIPDHDVGVRRFFHRKITFEHAAIDAKFFNAEFEVGR